MLDEIKVTTCLGRNVWLCAITSLFSIIANELAIGFKGSVGAWNHGYNGGAVRWVRPIHCIWAVLTDGWIQFRIPDLLFLAFVNKRAASII
jgi:hypothetical protein